ncbi:1-acyl-sn-glycerol-3-phosphate acyltransferase isoform X2 [Cryptomeria japonica]|uniref:1-acyl-sn-glycerol-3-phosphate acyltransferase isoform X2 n=1 Tax=Cryptomeria japonica TaxID=3369 RepID=UPI0025AC2144|nr:1-acyl-sn-glycerol-3-phosphate acyltransferase isoform X2 [Cryptomeria japonica]
MANSGVMRHRGYSQSFNMIRHADACQDLLSNNFSKKLWPYKEKLADFLSEMDKSKSKCCSQNSVYVEDNGWVSVALSVVKIVVCFVAMMATTFVWAVIMMVLLPWPYARIRQGNIYGHVTGRMLIIWYPLFGQLYVLANHLRIDRSNPTAAIESMKKAARTIVEKDLSLVIFPEGTRSKTGRLLPFKKGFVHMAIQSRRPIVPIVLTGTHLAWKKNSLHVRPAPLTVTYLPPISTEDWTTDKVDEYVEMLHSLYVEHLPDSQKPCNDQE